MRIRFLANTNIRGNPHDLSLPSLGIIYAGAELEVDDRLYRGAVFDQIDTYFKDSRGWYYWSGRIAIIYKELPPAKEAKPPPEEQSIPVGGAWKLPVTEENLDQKNIPAKQEPQELDTSKQPVEKKDQVTANEPDIFFPPQEESPVELPRESEKIDDANLPIDTSQYSENHPLLSKALKLLNIAKIWHQEKTWGSNIKVAILDHPIDATHPDIRRNFLQSYGASSGKASSTSEATMRAGLIAGIGTENFLGVSPQTSLCHSNIYVNNYEVDFPHFLNSLEWASSQKVDIIFTSAEIREDLLDYPQKKLVHEVTRVLIKKNILLIAPVGNSNAMIPENRYPGALSNFLSVGSVNSAGNKTSGSLRSASLDIMAPAENLYLASNKKTTTADSAALVAGIAALLLSVARKYQPGFQAAQLKEIFRQTAMPKFSLSKCRDLDYGCGIINLDKALQIIKIF